MILNYSRLKNLKVRKHLKIPKYKCFKKDEKHLKKTKIEFQQNKKNQI